MDKREYNKQYYLENRQRIRDHQREWKAANPDYQATWNKANPDRIRSYEQARYDRDGEKVRARKLARYHLKTQACEVCGDENAQRHHDDYTQPLDIRWLCQEHHSAEHNGG